MSQQNPYLRSPADFDAVPLAPQELTPASRPGNFILMLVISLIGYAVLALTYHPFINNWTHFAGGWVVFLQCVYLLFFLIFTALAGYYFLDLFNPRSHIRINPGAGTPGGKISLEWKLEGRVAALSQLTLSLECTEWASDPGYKSPNITVKVHPKITLLSITNREDFREGRAVVTLPWDLMHTLLTDSYKLRWAIRVHGAIRYWPDLHQSHALVIVPAGKEGER